MGKTEAVFQPPPSPQNSAAPHHHQWPWKSSAIGSTLCSNWSLEKPRHKAKITVYRAVVLSSIPYSCETWTNQQLEWVSPEVSLHMQLGRTCCPYAKDAALQPAGGGTAWPGKVPNLRRWRIDAENCEDTKAADGERWRQEVPCSTCGRLCVPGIGLRSHMRSHAKRK